MKRSHALFPVPAVTTVVAISMLHLVHFAISVLYLVYYNDGGNHR